jgi:hypothetical protein
VLTLTADRSLAATTDYCRRARRIRASFDRAPLLRHQALKDLARERNLQLLVNPCLAAVPKGRSPIVESRPFGTAAKREIIGPDTVANPSATENEFAVQVAAKLQPFGFTFSDRSKLLDIAERSGIPRFRANVILAMHEHQTGRQAANDPKNSSAAPSLLVVLMIEAVVVSALVWLCTL